MRQAQYIPGETGDWEIVIGMEVHAQVASESKLFSGASTDFGAGPNTQVALLDAGLPGTLPVLNKVCVEQAIRTGLGLKAQINTWSRFDRKNYFYPDLPLGYQISQYQYPIVGEGIIDVVLDADTTIQVGIERLHLEQDAGKSIHDLDPTATYVDLNRAGVALMEIVSKPDMRSSREAAAFMSTLREILRSLGTCGGDMEKGQMRADVNVSVRKPGAPLGTRCEIKNVNSMNFIAQAVEYEARRQIEIIEKGGKIDQETRLFDAVKGETRSMRSKEEAHDYRYFPDPDLLPLEVDPAWVEAIRASLPELPVEKRARFQRDYGLSAYDAGVLTADRETVVYYEAVAKGRDPKLAANWVTGDLFAAANKAGISLSESKVTAAHLGELIELIKDGTISGKIAKDIFERIWESGEMPIAVVKREGLRQVSDTGELERVVDQLIAENPDQVAQMKAKPKALGWFVGQAMKATGGKANPQAINDILKRKLELE
jgi:aspartyl-tRNA(Asn)/glutamyl-tRNA(Gln) amidotransferase subunit B